MILFESLTNPYNPWEPEYIELPKQDVRFKDVSVNLGRKAMFSIGDKIRFAEEKRPYTVQACNERFLICTKPFNLKHTVLYTIVDLKEGIRGADNYWRWGGYFDYETKEGCEQALKALTLETEEGSIEISHINRLKLNLV